MLEVIGFIGMFLILFAFVMNQLDKWGIEDLVYDSFNSVGAGILMYYSLMIGSLPFLILNSVWMVVSLKDVISDLNR